jgi:peroxiredoxin
MNLSRFSLILVVFLITACAPRPVSTVDANGVVRKEGQLSGRQQTGQWLYRDAQGQKEAQGFWSNDKQIGAWQWWYPNGNLKQQGSYAPMGFRTGWWSFHHPDGTVQAAGSYGSESDGMLDRQQGPWTYRRADGSVAATGPFIEGSRSLVWTTRAPDAALGTQGPYWQGVKIGLWFDGASWSDAGTPAGMAAYREPRSGTPRRWGMVQDGRPSGIWVLYTEDGRPLAAAQRGDRLRSLALYRSDGQADAWVSFAADGSRHVSAYVDGVPVADVAALPPAEDGSTLDERISHAVAGLMAPLNATPVEAPVAEVMSAPPPKELEDTPLSPLPVLPGLWTANEEKSVASLVRAYTRGRQVGTVNYDFAQAPGGDLGAANRLKGSKLPGVRVLASDGNVLDLGESTHRTVVVLLRGFSGQVCVYCASQTAAICDQIERFRKLDAKVVLLYPGSVESVPIFLDAVQSLGRTLPQDVEVAIDPDLAFVKAMNLEHMLARPTTLVIGRDGTVSWSYVGTAKDDRPGIDEVIDNVEAAP